MHSTQLWYVLLFQEVVFLVQWVQRERVVCLRSTLRWLREGTAMLLWLSSIRSSVPQLLPQVFTTPPAALKGETVTKTNNNHLSCRGVPMNNQKCWRSILTLFNTTLRTDIYLSDSCAYFTAVLYLAQRLGCQQPSSLCLGWLKALEVSETLVNRNQ